MEDDKSKPCGTTRRALPSSTPPGISLNTTMRSFSVLLCPLVFFLGAATVEAQAAPSPTVRFLYSANITVGLPVDVGAIPAGNVTVIPVIGGAILGPKISGPFSSHPTPPPHPHQTRQPSSPYI